MTEYFITARSFAAPFFSDESEKYVQAETPQAALSHEEIRHQTVDGFWVCWDKSPVKLSSAMRQIIDEQVAELAAILKAAR